MEALYDTTINKLVIETKLRIAELETIIKTRRDNVFAAAQNATNLNDMIKALSQGSVSAEETILEQFEDDLDYFESCSRVWPISVKLTKSEFKHYFRGRARPELC